MSFSLIITLMGNAVAADPEQSGRGDTGAEARTALGRADAASAKVIALEARVAKLEVRVRTLKAAGRKSDDPELRTAEAAVVQADDELAKAVKADAERAETAATRAETAATTATTQATNAEASAIRAEDAAKKLEGFTMPVAEESTNTLDTVNRDDSKFTPVVYGAVGIGNGWLGRQESYVSTYVGGGNTVETLEVDELLSNMIGLQLELGGAGLGDKGRLSVGLRLEGEYNFGGGFAAIAEGVVGGFVEQTHVLRVEGMLGVAWETLPSGHDEGTWYEQQRWDVGVGVELVPSKSFGILFTGRVLADNNLDFANGNNGGMGEIYLRFKR